jgi:hypothetical protein
MKAVDTANVRTGPGTNYPVIGQVSPGQTYEVTGRNQASDWWQFNYQGQTAWVSGQFVQPNTAARNAAVPSNIPAPPPTQRPQPQPTSPPPTATRPPTLFVQGGFESRNATDPNFDWVTFWGRLGRTTEYPISGGYRMRVTTPSGTKEAVFGGFWEDAYPGPNQFRYNAKIELPRVAGNFLAVVLDGSGKEVSDPITGNLSGYTHDVLLNWWKR